MVVRRKGRWLAAALAAAALLTAVPVADAQEAPPTGENGPVREADPEVVGGSVAAPGEFPWIVALTVRGQPVTSQFCGGSLIAPRRVLTAAHCVVGIVGAGQTTPANQISVLVGTNNLDGSGRRINVIGVHVHPGWNRNQNTFRNDLAALDLAAPANRPLIRGARPAEVGLGNAGRTVTVAGWGRIDPDLQIFPFDLRKGTFPVVSQGVCQSFFPGPTLFRYRHATNLCAGIPVGTPARATRAGRSSPGRTAVGCRWGS